MSSRQADIKAKRVLGIWWSKGSVEMPYRDRRAGRNDVEVFGMSLSSGSAIDSVKKKLPKQIKKREQYNRKWKKKRDQKEARNQREETIYIGDNS